MDEAVKKFPNYCVRPVKILTIQKKAACRVMMHLAETSIYVLLYMLTVTFAAAAP